MILKDLLEQPYFINIYHNPNHSKFKQPVTQLSRAKLAEYNPPGQIGLMLSEAPDDLLIVDIDEDDSKVRHLLPDTVRERSISGRGWHYFYIKSPALRNIKLPYRLKLTICDGEIFTPTPNKLAYVILTLKDADTNQPFAEINLDHLSLIKDDLFEIISGNSNNSNSNKDKPAQFAPESSDTGELSTMTFNYLLNCIPLLPYKPSERMQEQYNFKIEGSYDWWMTVLRGLKSAVAEVNKPLLAKIEKDFHHKRAEKQVITNEQAALEAWIQWSVNNPDYNDTPNYLRQKWEQSDEKGVSYKTLIKIVNSLFDWPDTHDGIRPHLSLKNFKYLFKTLGGKSIWDKHDTGNYIVKIGHEIFEAAEKRELSQCLKSFLRYTPLPFKGEMLKATADHLVRIAEVPPHPLVKVVKETEWDGKDRVTQVLDSLVGLQPEHRQFIHYNLKMVINKLLGPKRPTQGVVILSGRQKTYKSTWIRNISGQGLGLPGNFLGSISDFDVKKNDVASVVSSCPHILLDEIDQYSFKRKDIAKFKELITCDSVVIRRLYSQSTVRFSCLGVFWATTNSASLFSTMKGNRRFWLVPIKYCDVSIFNEENFIPQLYAQLFAEAKPHLANSFSSYWDEPSMFAQTENDKNSVIGIPELEIIDEDQELIAAALDYLQDKLTVYNITISTPIREFKQQYSAIRQGKLFKFYLDKAAEKVIELPHLETAYIHKSYKSFVGNWCRERCKVKNLVFQRTVKKVDDGFITLGINRIPITPLVFMSSKKVINHLYDFLLEYYLLIDEPDNEEEKDGKDTRVLGFDGESDSVQEDSLSDEDKRPK